MTYESIAGWSQVIAMGLFGLVIAGVLFYALRPGNKAKFDRAARTPLVVEDDTPADRPADPSLVRVEDEDKDGEASDGRK